MANYPSLPSTGRTGEREGSSHNVRFSMLKQRKSQAYLDKLVTLPKDSHIK